jgi:hypothetical protein
MKLTINSLCLCGNKATMVRSSQFVCDRCDRIKPEDYIDQHRRSNKRNICDAFTIPYRVAVKIH